MNQKGWTEYTDARLQRQEPISYNGDSTSIQESIDKGAKYLILSGIGQLYEKTYLQYFCKNMAGRYNNTLIFNLKDKYENFSLRNRTILRTYRCGANRKTVDGKAFIGEPDSTLFRNAETQSSDYAFENAFACKLSQAMPYGFTISMDNLVFGESFRVTAWRKISNKGSIIVSGKEYYNNSFEIIETKNGWEKLSKEFFITRELENKELTFYLYNNEAEPVYFDLFEISRFKSVID